MKNYLQAFIQRDFTDPVNLIPLLIFATIVIYFIAIFLDQPPE